MNIFAGVQGVAEALPQPLGPEVHIYIYIYITIIRHIYIYIYIYVCMYTYIHICLVSLFFLCVVIIFVRLSVSLFLSLLNEVIIIYLSLFILGLFHQPLGPEVWSCSCCSFLFCICSLLFIKS